VGHQNQFIARSQIQPSAEELFRWHAEPGALERLTPPWEPVEVEQRAPGIRNGDRGVLRVQLGPLRIRWVFEHRDCIERRQFRDVQLTGPFRRWEHTHLFTPEGPASAFWRTALTMICRSVRLGIFWEAGSCAESLRNYSHIVPESLPKP
jgi:ligand-binding SRPBCC domain-containing protein